MSRNAFKKFGFIRAALVASVGFPLLIAVSAYAQDPPVVKEATTERVTITGTYIPTAEGESALPVTVYQADVIQKAGANTPAEGLRQLPSYVGNTTTENDSNGGDGSASPSLRGLGPENVLTMINGRRAYLNVGTVTYTNINAIPIGGISRVEILKDGASSAYGSDAVSGVVNFIMLNGPGEAPYEGAEIFALYGNTTDTDARVWQGYVKGGVTGLDGKVSIAAAGEYYNREALFSRDRVIAASADRRSLGGNNQGSPTYAGRVTYRTNAADTASGQASTLIDLTNPDPKGGGPGGGKSPDYRKFDAAGAGTDPDRFNFRAYTPAIPGMEKANYYVTGRYKIFDDMLQVYGDILYTKQKQDNGLAAAPFGIDRATVNASQFNPFIGASDNAVDTGGTNDQLRSATYRLVNELGNRNSFYDYDYYRYVLGFNGDFNIKDNDFISNWSYNTGMVYYRSDQLRIDSGDATATGIFAGIVSGDFNPFIGQNAPPAGVGTTYDGEGNATGTALYDNTAVAQASAYLGHSFFYERSYLYDVTANANLFPGLYNGGIGLAGGYEYRHSMFHQVPDPVQAAGDQLGFNASPNTKYHQEVNSYFGEVKIPFVVSTMNVPWLRSAELSFAYRFEEFHNEDLYFNGVPPNVPSADFDNGGTPRVSVRIQPIEDITLRASWGQSFRSPFPFQLFDPASENFPSVFDPYFSGILQPPNAVTQAGTPGLQPEETDVWAAGMVITPRFLKGFTMTVDFYQEFTTNLIVGAASLAQIMITANALDLIAGNPNPRFVDPDGSGLGIFGGGPGLGVTRTGTGALDAVDSATTNAGKRLVWGMDLFAAYELPIDPNWGRFTVSAAYNYFFAWKAQASPTAAYTNYLGDFSAVLPLSPGAIPYHKGFLRHEWEWRGWDFLATVNYISSFNDDGAFSLVNTIPPGQIGGDSANPSYPFYRRVTDYITLDMQLSYEFRKPVTEAVATSYAKDAKDAKSAMAPVGGADNGSFAQRMLWNTRLTIGVNNAFDRNPPTVLGAFNDNYDTSLYSVRNRYWYTSISKKF